MNLLRFQNKMIEISSLRNIDDYCDRKRSTTAGEANSFVADTQIPFEQAFHDTVNGDRQEKNEKESVFGHLSNLPNELQDLTFSYLSAKDDALPVMSLPAAEYKKNATIALTIAFNGQKNAENIFDRKYSILESVRSLNPVLVPPIFVEKNGSLSFEHMCLLRSFPEGRLPNVKVLFLVATSSIDAMESVLSQLKWCLNHVETLVVEAYDPYYSQLFVFDLCQSGNRLEAIKYSLKGLPFHKCSPEKMILYLERCLRRTTVINLTEALITAMDPAFKIYSHHPIFRWRIFDISQPFPKTKMTNIFEIWQCHGADDIEMNYFPNLRVLICNTGIRFVNGNVHSSLASLILIPKFNLLISTCPFQLMPNLQNLVIHGNEIDFDTIVELGSCNQMKHLDLRFIHSEAIFNMGNTLFTLSTLFLCEFQGHFDGVENVWIEEFSLSQKVREESVMALSQRANLVQVKCWSTTESFYSPSKMFANISHLKFIYSDSVGFQRRGKFEFNTFSYQLNLDSLEIKTCKVHITPKLFPILRTLLLENCDVTFSYEDIHGTDQSFGHLRTMVCKSSRIECQKVTSLATSSFSFKNTLRKWRKPCDIVTEPFHLKAPQLTELQLEMVKHLQNLLIDHDSCPQLKIFRCVVTGVSHLPFNFWRSTKPLFPYLLDFSIKLISCVNEVNYIDFTQLFSLYHIRTIQVLGAVVIRNFWKWRSSCIFANFSSQVLLSSVSNIQPYYTANIGFTSFAEIQSLALSTMPLNKLLMIDGNVLLSHLICHMEGQSNLATSSFAFSTKRTKAERVNTFIQEEEKEEEGHHVRGVNLRKKPKTQNQLVSSRRLQHCCLL